MHIGEIRIPASERLSCYLFLFRRFGVLPILHFLNRQNPVTFVVIESDRMDIHIGRSDGHILNHMRDGNIPSGELLPGNNLRCRG